MPAAQQVDVQFIQVALKVGGPNSFEIRADPNPNAAPGSAKYFASRANSHPANQQFLADVLAKVQAAFGNGPVKLCVRGNEIVRSDQCA